jgi:trigger factor
MSAQLEVQGGIKRILTITVPSKEVDALVDKRLNEVSKQARLPGFRPGKAPVGAVKQQFGASIRGEILGQAIEKSYSEALVANELKPAGYPKIDFVQNEAGKDFIFRAELEVFPEFKVKGLDKIEVTKLNVAVTDKDLDKMLVSLQKQHTTWEKVERAAKNEDRVIIDFEGFIDGKAFEGGKSEDFRLVLGSNTMIPGFESGIVGKKAGTEFDITVTFPAEYQAPALAGKESIFKINLKEVAEAKLPDVTDEFAKLFQVDTVEALKNEVKGNMERELEFNLKGRVKEQVIEGLLKNNTVELPQSLVQEEAKRLSAQAAERMKSWGQQNIPEMPVEIFTAEAEKRVALGLIMNQIIRAENLQVDQDRVKAMIEKMASVYENPEEIVKFFYQNKAKLAEIEQLVLEEQVVDKVVGLSKVVEKTESFDEVMKNQAASALPQA